MDKRVDAFLDGVDTHLTAAYRLHQIVGLAQSTCLVLDIPKLKLLVRQL